jgi:hypothetical protein
MAEYYSNVLRDLAKMLDSDEDISGFRKIYARIAVGSADRIDELQMQLGGRIEHIARQADTIMHLKENSNGKNS